MNDSYKTKTWKLYLPRESSETTTAVRVKEAEGRSSLADGWRPDPAGTAELSPERFDQQAIN